MTPTLEEEEKTLSGTEPTQARHSEPLLQQLRIGFPPLDSAVLSTADGNSHSHPASSLAPLSPAPAYTKVMAC